MKIRDREYEVTISPDSQLMETSAISFEDLKGYKFQSIYPRDYKCWLVKGGYVDLDISRESKDVKVTMSLQEEESYLFRYTLSSFFDSILFDIEPKLKASLFDISVTKGKSLLCISWVMGDHEIIDYRIEELLDATERSLNRILDIYEEASVQEKILVSFSFPKEVATICKMYLMYFSEFLEDNGLKARLKLSDFDEKIIFTAWPTDKESALWEIACMLGVYLNLPLLDSNSEETLSHAGLKICSLHTKAQVRHFKSQIREFSSLRPEIIDSKTKVQSANHVLLDSIGYSKAVKKEEAFEILYGVIKIKKIKGNGYEIDLPKILSIAKSVLTKRKKN